MRARRRICLWFRQFLGNHWKILGLYDYHAASHSLRQRTSGDPLPPKPLLDLSSVDLEQTVFDKSAIEAINPHRFEMSLLDRIVHFNRDSGIAVGVKPVREDEFWVAGHFPGRPVLPGVLMLESAAQLSSFVMKKVREDDRVIGFAATDECRFRRTVGPGTDLLIVAQLRQSKPRAGRFDTQGYVDGKLVFEAVITGMLI